MPEPGRSQLRRETSGFRVWRDSLQRGVGTVWGLPSWAGGWGLGGTSCVRTSQRGKDEQQRLHYAGRTTTTPFFCPWGSRASVWLFANLEPLDGPI